MTKEFEFPTSAILQSAPSKLNGSTASARSPTASPSPTPASSAAAAHKYRVGFASIAISASTSPTATGSSSPKARSASQQVPSQHATSILAMMKKTTTNARISAPNGAMLAAGVASAAGAAGDNASGGLEAAAPSSPKAKLPLKLRQHVSRLRSQFALVASPSGSFNTKSGAKLAHRVSGLGPNLSPSKQQTQHIGGGGSSPSSRALNTKAPSPTAATASEPKYSSQSRKMQTLQAQLSTLRISSRSVLKSNTHSAAAVRTTAVGTEKKLPESAASTARDGLPDSPTKDDADPIRFFDLLRPLQNSLSCASLMSEWGSDDEDYAGDVGGSDPQQRSPERHRSRMLRICCSVDNLLLSIGSQVQEEKHDEAIARGAARQLLELFQFAIQQVATTPSPANRSDVSGENSSSGGIEDDKELQYMQEFIIEIVERMSKLDQFVRCTFLSEIDGLKQHIEHDEQEMSELKQANTQLQTEMADLRDFHSQSNMSVLGFARNNSSNSSSSFVAGEPAKDENQERMAGLFSKASASTSPSENEMSSGTDELQQLRGQCEEFARLLEMAKQEIRLCHREHDVQKSRIAELSNAMFKDQELMALRNQLQSDKRRVKNLEIENVALRETQVDQVMKIQSLMANGAHR